MTKPSSIHRVLVLGFLAVICSAGLIQIVVETRHGQWPQALELFRQKPSAAGLRAYEHNLEESSWVIKQLRPWMQYAQFMLLRDAGEKALVGRDGWLFYKPGVAYLTEQPPRAAGQATHGPLPAIIDFRDQLAARGLRLIVVPAPNKESVYPDRLSRRADALRGAVCPATRALLADLQRAGVEVVDLFATFHEARQLARPGAPLLYLTQDTHWSPAGVALAAQVVAQRVLERGWAVPQNVPYESQPVRIRRVGDLVRMLQVPPLESRVLPEEIPCLQVVQGDTGQPYRDEPGSEVLVLGDSFLRIYEQDEPGAAGFIAHLARELRQPLTSLVNDGGASTLVRQELFRRPQLLRNKRVVIWEFVERDTRFGTEGWQIVPLPPDRQTAQVTLPEILSGMFPGQPAPRARDEQSRHGLGLAIFEKADRRLPGRLGQEQQRVEVGDHPDLVPLDLVLPSAGVFRFGRCQTLGGFHLGRVAAGPGSTLD